MFAPASLVALCPSPLAVDACVPVRDLAVVKAEIETFNNATFVGRTSAVVAGVVVRGFAFKGTGAVAGGVARTFGRNIYRIKGGPSDGCYFIARD